MAIVFHKWGQKAMDNVIETDPYEIVIADLKAKKAQIDQAIVALEALRGITAVAVSELRQDPAVVAELNASVNRLTGSSPGPGELLGMSIGDASKKILQARRNQATTSDIVVELERGGVVLTSADKINTVGSLLLRRFYNVGDIVRIKRGVWGLQEWYPGRRFPGSKSGLGNESVPETITSKEEGAGNIAETEVDKTINPFEVPANRGDPYEQVRVVEDD